MLGQEALLVAVALGCAQLGVLGLELPLPTWLGPFVLLAAPLAFCAPRLERLGQQVVWDVDVHVPGIWVPAVPGLLLVQVLDELLDPAVQEQGLWFWSLVFQSPPLVHVVLVWPMQPRGGI